MQFHDVDKAMIRVVKYHCEVIFSFLTNRNCHFFEGVKAMIQVAQWHVKIISCLLQAQYLTLLRSGKRCFKWSPGNQNSFSFSWPVQKGNGWSQGNAVSRGRISLWIHIRPLNHPKMRLGWVRKSDISWSRMAFSTSWKCNLMKTKKQCFRWLPGNQKSFSSSWPTQNATWVKSKKQRYKRSHVTLNSYSASWPS